MKTFMRTTALGVAVALLGAASCGAPAGTQNGGSASGAASRTGPDTAAARAAVARLEADARALVKTDGCATSGQCRTAQVGVKSCGGPRDYLVYCAASTDSVALFRKLDELRAAESEYNKISGMMSTCELRLPPKAAVQGGSCREVAP
jgi:hypothetical protein